MKEIMEGYENKGKEVKAARERAKKQRVIRSKIRKRRSKGNRHQ